jgi:hypothetical protein
MSSDVRHRNITAKYRPGFALHHITRAVGASSGAEFAL